MIALKAGCVVFLLCHVMSKKAAVFSFFWFQRSCRLW